MKQQTWFAIEILADTAAAEAIEFGLNELESLGSEINTIGQKEAAAFTKIIGYFNEEIADEIIKERLYEALRIYGFDHASLKSFRWQAVENKDWLEEWKKSWKPTHTAKFVIAPKWQEVETEKHLIRIEPSMAFGTGTHETTKLCIKAIEDNFEAGESFFDVGTGTGILAIAYAMLGNADARILGCDTDEDSIKIAEENIELNGVGRQIGLYTGSIDDNSDDFDFICANLTAEVIIPILPYLAAKANKKLLLSGILGIQKDSILDELRKLNIFDPFIESDGEWISVFIKK